MRFVFYDLYYLYTKSTRLLNIGLKALVFETLFETYTILTSFLLLNGINSEVGTRYTFSLAVVFIAR